MRKCTRSAASGCLRPHLQNLLLQHVPLLLDLAPCVLLLLDLLLQLIPHATAHTNVSHVTHAQQNAHTQRAISISPHTHTHTCP